MEYFVKSLPYSSNLKTAAKSRKGSAGLIDAELAAKYDTGERVDFDSALGAMATTPSNFAVAKPPKAKR